MTSLPLRCMVVDDDSVSRKVLERYVGQCDSLALMAVCETAVEAANRLAREDVDLLFLDIEMPEMTGLELARSLEGGPPVILVTGKEDYALDAFEADVIDYLLKPIDYGRFLRSVKRATRRHSPGPEAGSDDDFVFIKVDGRLVKLDLRELVWVEAQGDYVMLHTPQKKHMIHATMKSMAEKLPSRTFVRVHRSHIVRLDKIADIEEGSLVIGREVIPIGASYRGALMSRLRLI